ncbi:MAG: EamA family transporter [Coriobacteriia bacterium]|nr:EamA family transporter [Coriobacteriia bacterium]
MNPLNPATWPHKAKLIAAFATLYIVWGTTYLAIRIGLDAQWPPAAFAGLRLLPAGLILLGISRVRGVSMRVSRRDLRTIIMVGLLLLVGGQYGTYLAEQYIGSGLTALTVALLPLWIAGAESLLPDMERPTARGYLGLVLGFAGLGILLAPRIAGISGSGTELLGIGIEILATWLWTTGSIVSKRRPVKADALVATGYEMLAAGAALVLIATVRGEWSQISLTPAGVGSLVYLILIGSCVAFTAFVWLLRHAPASKVMTYAYVNPVVAVFLGWLVLSEPIDGWMIAGMAVIVTGVALATSAPTRPGRRGTIEHIAEPSEV